MVVFQYKGKSFGFDNRLDRDLRTKVYPDLLKNDKDNVFLVDGNEGTGKSKFGDILGAHAGLHLECDYDLNSVCLSPEEFRNRIQDCPNRSVVIYDEAHRGMGSTRSLSEINNILKDLMMEMRQKNLYVIIILPSIFFLDKYAALFRSKGLFHVYERKRKRGYWVFFNEENKKKLYVLGKKFLNYNCMKWPNYRGRFFNQYSIDEVAYRAKKLKVFKQRPSLTKAEAIIDQRNLLIKYLYNLVEENKTQFTKRLQKIGLKLKREMITDIVNGRTTKNYGITMENHGIEAENGGEDGENTEDMSIGKNRMNDITTNNKEQDGFDGEEEDFEENIEAFPSTNS